MLRKKGILMAEKITAARLVAQTLKAYGITHTFYMDAVMRRVLPEMELALERAPTPWD